MAEWIPQTHVRLERNPKFFDAESVSLDALYFHPTENLGTAIDRFRAGEIDVVPFVPKERLDWIEDNMPEALMVHPSLGVEFLIFNTTRPPFDDVRLRQALSMSIRSAYSIVHRIDAGYDPTLYADTRNGNFEVARAAWYPEAVDPSTYLYLLRSTSGPMNQSG